ncbi:hypothetical protein [Nocardia cyriacigeorgica]|nr:hypothetical protein [Nocardia cyriacigeorgica]
MDTVLCEFGITRLTWQVLNVIADGAAYTTDAHIHTVLAANANRSALDAAIAATLAGHWATRPEPGQIAMTDHGRQHLTRVGDRVADFRTLSMHGITADEYHTAVSVLERMTLNVENADVS